MASRADTVFHLMSSIRRSLADKTCPICGHPAGVGITCGSQTCVRNWIFPGKKARIAPVPGTGEIEEQEDSE